ncbi:MAG: hypothetical protein WD926_01140 [Patescibacteria group bacterium]
MELHTADGQVRGPILGVEREEDDILFERAWLARHDESGWSYCNPHDGTNYRIASVDVKPPVKRADGTMFINLPEFGCAVIYPREHPELLGLRANVSLELIETPAS